MGRRIVILTLVATVAVGAAGCDWLQFGFDAGGSRFNPFEKAITTTNVSTLVQRFKTPTGGQVGSSPAVANGVVYVGSRDRNLYAFDARSGVELWTASTGNTVDSSPAVANGVVYVGAGDSYLYAFDAAGNTGCSGTPKVCSPLWTAHIPGGTFANSPAVVNGSVYITSGGELSAVDAKTGTLLWSAIPPSGATNPGNLSNPVVDNGTVYVDLARVSGFHMPESGGYLFAYNASSGARLWTSGLQGNTNGIPGSVAVVNRVAYVGAEFNSSPLYAFDAGSGALLWTTGDVGGAPAVANGVVYFGSDNSFFAFDAAGQQNCHGTVSRVCDPLWTGTILSGTGPAFDTPAVANGVVYVGSEDDSLYAFDAAGKMNCAGVPTSCSPLWSATTGGFVTGSSPAVANGVVYVGSFDHNLYAYNLP